MLNGDNDWYPTEEMYNDPACMVPNIFGEMEYVWGEPVPEHLIPESPEGPAGKSDVDELLPPQDGDLPAFGPRMDGRWAKDGWKDVGPRILWVFRQVGYEIIDGVFKGRKALDYKEPIDEAWEEGKEYLPDDPMPDTSGEYGDPNRGKVGYPVGPLAPQ